MAKSDCVDYVAKLISYTEETKLPYPTFITLPVNKHGLLFWRCDGL